MAVEIITKEDLQLFKAELVCEIKQLLAKDNSRQDGEWLRSSQVMKILPMSANTLQALRISGKLNFTKVGGIFYYKREDVRRMLEGNS
ncbi:helix-turn-helix domain-containing protein [Mucilaginibacter sp. NFX135]|uniref:helix-turn-helix domain-containing protein n=1 Tax=Mucilaginibacter sp. NFX135 TaxID=3402687 RepID=UPI003AFB0E2D